MKSATFFLFAAVALVASVAGHAGKHNQFRTNGQRLARGLSPLKPVLRYDAKRQRSLRPRQSATASSSSTVGSTVMPDQSCGCTYTVQQDTAPTYGDTSTLVSTTHDASVQECLSDCDNILNCYTGSFDETTGTCSLYSVGPASTSPDAAVTFFTTTSCTASAVCTST
ncbi:MAG: hypothetical protein CYPHOPRED_005519 [Cyphobasidiales sp. Tagirdzhanova-0007]|nr:MAG: hypothetical protein CYPHOPRED_005519 [Cyphobasidiales sp. Tagirdzhanova-0007]